MGFSIIFCRFFQCLCRQLLPGTYGYRRSGASWPLRAPPVDFVDLRCSSRPGGPPPSSTLGALPELPPQTQKYIGETCVSFQLTHIFQLLLPKLRFDSIRDSHTRPLRNLSSQLFVFVLLVKIEILFFDIPHYHTRKLQKGPFSKYRNFEEVTCFNSFFLSF